MTQAGSNWHSIIIYWWKYCKISWDWWIMNDSRVGWGWMSPPWWGIAARKSSPIPALPRKSGKRFHFHHFCAYEIELHTCLPTQHTHTRKTDKHLLKPILKLKLNHIFIKAWNPTPYCKNLQFSQSNAFKVKAITLSPVQYGEEALGPNLDHCLSLCAATNTTTLCLSYVQSLDQQLLRLNIDCWW